MKINSGFIVVIAYPEVVVSIARGELVAKIWPLLGVGGQQKVKAGHAAMLLVSKETNKINYFDFGRYITSITYGRVRSEETDNEVHIPIMAIHNSQEIQNLDEILLYLDKHPEKTHGEGRMITSVNNEIDYDKALSYILELQNEIEVPYGAFIKNGSNCARFVTDTMIVSTTNKKIKNKLKRSYLVTPSPISSVLRGRSAGYLCLETLNQEIKSYENKYVLVEHKKCLFSKVSQTKNDVGSVKPDLKVFTSENGQWLGGIGSGAWFELGESASNDNTYKIIRRNAKGIVDLDDLFILDNSGFSNDKPYVFQHGSNCKQCVILQNNTAYCFKRVKYLSA
tara:strand:- start:22135 stop:23148 length:1014 start_codon:yes stop_codon:yes gene_type:complete